MNNKYLVLIFPSIIVAVVLPASAATVDELQVSVSGLSNVYEVGEFLDFTLHHPRYCGETDFYIEDTTSGNRIWESGISSGGCEAGKFGRFWNLRIFSSPPTAGGIELHVPSNVTDNEGSFKFVYQAGDIKKVWQYTVFEEIPVFLDQGVQLRVMLFAFGYAGIVLYVYKDDISKKFRR